MKQSDGGTSNEVRRETWKQAESRPRAYALWLLLCSPLHAPSLDHPRQKAVCTPCHPASSPQPEVARPHGHPAVRASALPISLRHRPTCFTSLGGYHGICVASGVPVPPRGSNPSHSITLRRRSRGKDGLPAAQTLLKGHRASDVSDGRGGARRRVSCGSAHRIARTLLRSLVRGLVAPDMWIRRSGF